MHNPLPNPLPNPPPNEKHIWGRGNFLPTGTVTFLFTDIQGSTPLWEREPEKMAAALQIHNAALRQAIEANGGVVFKTVGDAFQAVFAIAPLALKAAIEGQRLLHSASWNELGPLHVRMGLHTGEAELDPGGDEYAVSHTKNRIGRIHSVAYGGQILLSQETADLVMRTLPEGVSLKDLGEHRLKGMQWLERLYQICATGLLAEFPPLRSESRPSHNLPLELTAFIGRQREIAQVQELLRAHRMVTLTGSGGVGKTRLSIQAAGGTLVEFPDGVWYVELASISDPDLLPQTVAVVLGLRDESTRPVMETLSAFLTSRELLLVLDNCEHLLEACARLADALLRKAPRLKILTSSREALGIAGEYAFRVPSLSAPDPRQMPSLEGLQEYEAVQLFVDRARCVLPTFELHERNAHAIAAICQRLDGIPLALELAAARLNILTPEQLASRLDHAFRLLTGGSRTALPRQQTLRAAIDWSYQLLSDQEQVLLRRLAVFAGGGTLEAIEAVCAGKGLEMEQILNLLSGLVNKSIVSAERKQKEETRYRLLETVRQYAREKLYESKESQVFHDRHLDYFLGLAEAIEPQLRTSVALERLQVLNLELDNMRAALSWSLDETGSQKIEAGLRLASALLNFWHTQSFHNEGYTWLNKGLSASPGVPANSSVRARACFSAGHLILPLGRQEETRQLLQKSLDIYRGNDDITGVVMAQSLLGENCAWSGAFDEARELGEASVAMCRTLNDPWLLAWSLCRYGTSLFYQGEHSLARPLLEESLAIFEQLGDQLQVGDHYINLGTIQHNRGDLSKANAYYQKALISTQAMQSNWNEANVLHCLGNVAYEQNEYQQMQAFLQQSVSLNRETGSPRLRNSLSDLGVAEINLGQPRQAAQHFKECLQMSTDSNGVAACLLGIARVALQTNQALPGARLLGAFKRLLEVDIHQFWPMKEYEYAWAEAKGQLDAPALEQAISEGQAMTLEQAVAFAMEVRNE